MQCRFHGMEISVVVGVEIRSDVTAMSQHRALFTAEFTDHIAVSTAASVALATPFALLAEMAIACLAKGGKLLLFGNGGSAADAQHWAAELTVRYRKTRRALAALALTTDSSALTAIGNDFGFEQLFARQVEALALPGDLAIGISTSGQSSNVIAGIMAAHRLGCKTVAFTGHDGGRIATIVDLALIVPSSHTGRIQEIHEIVGHALCDAVESHFGGT
jgi:D-sedoheptulose 7-phosphate isomerase